MASARRATASARQNDLGLGRTLARRRARSWRNHRGRTAPRRLGGHQVCKVDKSSSKFGKNGSEFLILFRGKIALCFLGKDSKKIDGKLRRGKVDHDPPRVGISVCPETTERLGGEESNDAAKVCRWQLLGRATLACCGAIGIDLAQLLPLGLGLCLPIAVDMQV